MLGRRDAGSETAYQQLDLPRTNLDGARLAEAYLSGADLREVELGPADPD